MRRRVGPNRLRRDSVQQQSGSWASGKVPVTAERMDAIRMADHGRIAGR